MQAPKVFRLHVMRVRHFTVLKLNILFEAVELCGQDLISSDNIKNIKDTKRAPILFIWESFPPPPSLGIQDVGRLVFYRRSAIFNRTFMSFFT